MSPRRAAFFDLDGTLMKVNTVARWLAREGRAGRVGKRQMLRALGVFTAYRLGISAIEPSFREAVATLRGQLEHELLEQTLRWWQEEIAHTAAPGAWSVLESHRQAGDLLVLLTTSSAYAAEAARRQFALHEVLCTRYEIRDGRFTGAIVDPVCFGVGKVTLAEALAGRLSIDLDRSSFYTDSVTDLPMLERVGHPRAVNPDGRLAREARRRGWPVLDWRRTR